VGKLFRAENRPTATSRAGGNYSKNFIKHIWPPVEVLLAEDVSVPEEALVVEQLLAGVAADALGVPLLVQHRQQEPRVSSISSGIGVSGDTAIHIRISIIFSI
jgi:hypothetical protein